ncbi:hypothetical protein ABB37_01723 [Leptomonas pyrrhocoris]|uniref:Uncharacterized protein n=1 Tax=Leptomonas pyrrhocoris TaxID=157538 RepID=A0A0N0VHH1_LEPPY|nr:hypothetical protein ABB37_01723 [Leptomonas pyrrhocoris]XP_015663854.1 hypothetical protein ABB37_01723 [Leptomonas pyrrhocoris]KPA85414.1 hypothetical protein ABB37_01723 [Leptomonas pyrrhocoris]KPA85415.1 hypothetical protein ABB37_01723 [Leptomonas pyrrhocoris]|eukprot:XP_015663853.1 hypothetical protein ABB37_01723 [Leptomonas pyrrhocoris]
MFFAGGTFGHESEAREANKRQTGRRHQPQDMALSPTGNVPAGPVASEDTSRHMNDQKQMSAGPSFMDRMYAHDASAGQQPHAARRQKAGPRDNLNIFSWQEADKAQVSPQQAGRGPREARSTDATMAVPTAEDRRAQESKKFETHSASTFLKFSDTPVKGQQAPTPNATRRASGSAQQGGGMMGELMRDQPQRPHGKRIQAEQQRTAKQTGAGGEVSGVAGFPGMGQNSAPRPGPQSNRKQAPSNVFPPSLPPWAQHDDAEADRKGAPPPASAQRQPAYRLDGDDYESRHYDEGDVAGANQVPPRRMQEIEMYDDDEDNYAPVPQQQQRQQPGGGRPQPKWLDVPEEGAGRQGGAPAVSQHRYGFNPEHQEFYDDGEEEPGRHVH